MSKTHGVVAAVSLVTAAVLGLALTMYSPEIVLALPVSILTLVMIVRSPFIGVMAHLCVTALAVGEIVPALSTLRLERVVGVITLFAVLGRQVRTSGFQIDNSLQTKALLGLASAAIVSVPFAVWRSQAVESLMELSKILVIYYLIVHGLDTRPRIRIYLLGYAILTSATNAIAYARFAGGHAMEAQGMSRIIDHAGESGDPNALGTSAAAIVPLYLALLGWQGTIGLRAVGLVGAVLGLVVIGLSGSRASVLGMLGGLIYYWARSSRRLAYGFAGVVALTAAFATLPEEYRDRYRSITDEEVDESSEGRLKAWKAGGRMVLARPLTGVGLGCFPAAYRSGDYTSEGEARWLQPHNVYMQVAAEVGLPGASVFLIFVLGALWLNRKTYTALDDGLPATRFERGALDALVAGFVVLLISGLFGHSLLRRTWYVYAALGCAMARVYLPPRSKPIDSRTQGGV